eukprot:3311937-Alexandrium_andersonii.AAC.1
MGGLEECGVQTCAFALSRLRTSSVFAYVGSSGICTNTLARCTLGELRRECASCVGGAHFMLSVPDTNTHIRQGGLRIEA